MQTVWLSVSPYHAARQACHDGVLPAPVLDILPVIHYTRCAAEVTCEHDGEGTASACTSRLQPSAALLRCSVVQLWGRLEAYTAIARAETITHRTPKTFRRCITPTGDHAVSTASGR
jgi:hypothetical protein